MEVAQGCKTDSVSNIVCPISICDRRQLLVCLHAHETLLHRLGVPGAKANEKGRRAVLVPVGRRAHTSPPRPAVQLKE